MFIDQSKIEVRSGKGGDGAIAFLRLKFMPHGGPAGGNGGKGGSIYFRANKSINTSVALRCFVANTQQYPVADFFIASANIVYDFLA